MKAVRYFCALACGGAFLIDVFALEPEYERAATVEAALPDRRDDAVTIIHEDKQLCLKQPVILTIGGASVVLLPYQVLLLDSKYINLLLTDMLRDSKEFVVELPAEDFDITTVQVLIKIFEDVFTGEPLLTAVHSQILTTNIACFLIKLLDYLQAGTLESFIVRIMLKNNLLCTQSDPFFAKHIAENYGTLVDTEFLSRVIMPDALVCTKVLPRQDTALVSVAYSPDGAYLASGGWSDHIYIWDVVTGACIRTITEPMGCVYTLAWSPDGLTLASGSEDHTVRLWHVASGICEKIFHGHENWVSFVQWSSDGTHIITKSGDHTRRLWNVLSGACERIDRMIDGGDGWSNSMVYSTDYTYMVSGHCDNVVRIWTRDGHVCKKKLIGHCAPVLCVTFDPDGKHIASGSYDGTVRIWGNDELDACLPLEKLFVLMNMRKRLSRVRALKNCCFGAMKKLCCCSSARVLPEFPLEWLSVYQTLSAQAKLLIDPSVKNFCETCLEWRGKEHDTPSMS